MTTATALERRIDEVLKTGKFPDAKAWCLRAGLSHGYIGTLKSRLRKGKAVQGKSIQIQKLARVAGVTVEWLMGLTPNPSGDDPLFRDLVFEINLRPGMADAIREGAERYHTLTIVKALQMIPSSQAGGGVPSIGWTKLLDDIEQGRNEPTTGNTHDVHEAAKKQVGRRPQLPPGRMGK